MRITETVSNNEVWVGAEDGDSRELYNIGVRLMPEWLKLFASKNADYGDGAKILGVRGQYADMNRKMLKLKRSLWDGEQLQFEDSEEVVMDLIGHLFLTLHMLRFKEEADRSHAFSDLSTDEFVNRFIEELGGPSEALRISATLSESLSSRVRARCRELLGENIVHSAWTPDKRVPVAERMAGEEFAQADFEQSNIRLGGITSIEFQSIGEHEQQERLAERLKRGTDEATYGAREARSGERAADGRPGEATLRAMAENGAYGFRVRDEEDEQPTVTLLDLIDKSNKLADEQREIAKQMYKMTRGL